MPSRLFTLRNLLLVLAAWIVVAVVSLVAYAPYAAEHRLECVHYVMGLVTEHVRAHGGKWPKNWEAVERVYPPSQTGDRPCEWPQIRQNVEVDFRADPAALVEQGPEAFQAIRPKGRCGDYTEDVEALLAAIRSVQKAKTPEKPETPGQPDEGKVSASGSSGSSRP